MSNTKKMIEFVVADLITKSFVWSDRKNWEPSTNEEYLADKSILFNLITKTMFDRGITGESISSIRSSVIKELEKGVEGVIYNPNIFAGFKSVIRI